MIMMRGLMVVAAMLSLAACSGFKSQKEVEALNEARAVGSPFTQQLAAEYRDFANDQQNNDMDYSDARHFARKGLAAAAGEVVLPEPVSDWNLNAEEIEKLSAARVRLMRAFEAGAREIAPKEAAMAQGRYDCWIDAAEEGSKPRDGQVSCAKGFEDVMAALDSMVQAPVQEPVAPAPAAVGEEMMPPVEPLAVDPSQPMAAQDAVYLVFFDFDRSNVLPAGQSVIDAAVKEMKKRQLTTITVTGHADTAGPKGYNKRLSLRRAKAVQGALVAAGMDPKLIRVEHRGEEELMVPTPDGVREPANRRAVITFE